MQRSPSAIILRLMVVALCASICIGGCFGGGGGGGSSPSAAVDGTDPTAAISAVGETARSVDDGVTWTLAFIASDNVGVTAVTVVISLDGAAVGSPLILTYDSGTSTWRGSRDFTPPIAGHDEYTWTATVRDAVGNDVVIASDTVDGTSVGTAIFISGPTPPPSA